MVFVSATKRPFFLKWFLEVVNGLKFTQLNHFSAVPYNFLMQNIIFVIEDEQNYGIPSKNDDKSKIFNCAY